MTEMSSYVVENPTFEPNKPKKQYKLYSSLLPIFLSVFAYILIFYVLDVSASSIFKDTKILFIISNALIIIIAADYGAFTDKEKQVFYGEYTAAMRSNVRENPRLENSSYEHYKKTDCYPNQQYEVSFVEEIKNHKKQVDAVGAKDIPQYLVHKEAKVTEKTVRVVSKNQPINIATKKYEPTTEQNSHITDVKGETCNTRILLNSKPYGRSKSDKARGSVITKEGRPQEIKHRPKSYDRSQSDSSKWLVVRKGIKAEEAEEKWENVRDESEEFSKMSNEELNRRVEDFIQRFNRDIKRQI